MPNIDRKRAREKAMVTDMIALYCRKHHHTPKGQLCDDCAALARYAQSRSDHCPFMETKTFCANCRVHCYAPEKREQIRVIMRYAGPRMIFYHPLAACYHLITSQAEKRRLRREDAQK